MEEKNQTLRFIVYIRDGEHYHFVKQYDNHDAAEKDIGQYANVYNYGRINYHAETRREVYDCGPRTFYLASDYFDTDAFKKPQMNFRLYPEGYFSC